MFKFKHFYTMGILMAGTLSSHAQTILTNPVTEQNKSVTDPYSIRLLPGFNAASPAVNSFRASLGASSNPNPTPNYDSPNPTASISVNENYIYSRTYLAPRSFSDPAAPQQQSISYFDGLGRPKQELSIKSTPNGQDLVSDIPYDSFGRQVQSWLPVPMGSQNGNIQSGVQTAASGYYKKADGSTDPLAYGEKTLENSPLDRILAQAAPGSDWDGKKVQYQYATNADGEVYRYTTSTSWSNNATVSVLGLSGTYGANSLYKNIETDEDGNSTIEFKNIQGQTILVRKNNGYHDMDTYYIYNEYDQIAFVIPPLAVHKGVDSALLNELAYQYRYDGQNRLVEKKLPGKDWEYMVYDEQDRLVLTQDGKLRKQNKWIFTKYDKLGRLAYTGLMDSEPGRDAQQTIIDNNVSIGEDRITAPTVLNELNLYYTLENTYPQNNISLLTINYYDEYPPGSPAVFNGVSALGSNPVNGRSTKGLPVASMVKNIEDNGWTKSYTWYDDKARPVATESQNHLGGYTRTSSVLAFSGVPTSTTTYHKRDASSGEMMMKEDFSYDHQNRLVKHTHQLNGGPVEVLTENIYNELGQLESRNIGNGIQSIKNEYNIRGALTKMNDPKNLLNKLFGFELKYINPQNTSKKYNGNIAETDWATQSDGTLRRYSYQYDGVNRLKEGNYWDNAGAASGSYTEKLNYDLNGNITGLQRTGQGAGVMDQLSYTYDQAGKSNKLIRVNDASGNAAGYPVGGNTIVYDINGNMVNHLDKGISNIAYNYLNLPSSITASIGNTDYVYRADGSKVKKVFGGKTTDYLDGFQYENGVLQFVPTSEGYYDLTKNKYIYNYTDHLGNVRLSYTKGASGGAEIIEENNYYPFGLKHQGYNSASLANNVYQYKYNGKELQETGMYDYGARMYMPELGRWISTDPLGEKRPSWTPYRYSYNNPINFVDPTGLLEDWVYNRDSNSIYWNEEATSQSTAGANETYLGKSGTYTTESGSTTALHSDRSYTNNSLLGGLGAMNNLDLLIQAGNIGPAMSRAAFGDPDSPTIQPIPESRGKSQIQRLVAENPLVQSTILTALTGGATNLLFRNLGGATTSTLAESRALGKAGEEAVGITEAKVGIKMGDKMRFPDRVTSTTLEEVKNVKSQSFTRQLRDYLNYSQQTNKEMILYTRPTTKISGPLQQVIDNGQITHKFIP
ncbi:DUF6443 domain-containing protein [Elizabethkingia ursingii]|uniref:DUF6443 domain-containing protein n=1 Tax=Elizabethkingia ursingii TaxID=1756150 RepID=UPI00201304F0|nr:DUF6443 domain-containing protein [Elizabethkingia ursingii]MCL1665584.1 DUF6443 domain-containing protein [Elizabethkingia ursingii]